MNKYFGHKESGYARTAEKVASDVNESREAYVQRMADEGCVPSYPGPNELQIDIDNKVHRAAFDRSFEILNREMGGGLFALRTPSKSGKGEHVRIHLPFELDVWQRIAWQAALGSDPVRELLSCLRATQGSEHPTMLIERAGA